jgi:hypothetical protein
VLSPARQRPLLLALAATVLFAGSAGVAHLRQPPDEVPFDVGFVPAAQPMRWLSLGHPTLVANANWLRAVQYMGDPRADRRGWEKLKPLVDLVTDLDPRHGYAYQTSANMLASAGRVDESNAILEKGARNVPDRYIIPFQRAVNAFLYAADYPEAGRWFERAAATPGAPPRIREYVVAMYVKGDVSEAAIGFLQRIEEEAQDDESRRAVRSQIKRAVLERDALQIETAAEAWHEEFGTQPIVPASLVMDGFLSALPDDPFGGEYYFDKDGRVRSTAFFEKRFERPLDAQGRPFLPRQRRQDPVLLELPR